MTTPSTPTIPTTPTTAPTAALLHDAAAYRTCEFATMTRAGVPVAWPAVCLVSPDGGEITLTTSIALPRKAVNVRRDPRVALLFSDPTGSGRPSRAQVLVRGTATCRDEIVTSPAGLEDYWLRLWERQPDLVDASGALTRRLMDFYYFRLVIRVTPVEVVPRPPVERVPASPAPPAPGGRDAWGETVRRLAAYDSAVLGTAADGELPDLRRVRVTADPRTRLLHLHAADGVALLPVAAGRRANLLVHGHDERLSALRQFGVLGSLVHGPDGPALRPERVLAGSVPQSPVAMAATVLRLRRVARTYLADRGLPRPAVAWDDFARLQAAAGRR